jgi:hypothetical protein
MLTRLDDELLDHDKVEDAAEKLGKRGHILALGMATFGILYGNRKLTDGFLKSSALVKYGIDQALAEAIVDAGLWDRVDGGYRVHDFLDHNPSAAEVKAKRSKDRQRKRKAFGFRDSDAGDSTEDSERIPSGGADSVVEDSPDSSDGIHPRVRAAAPAGAPKGQVRSGQDGNGSSPDRSDVRRFLKEFESLYRHHRKSAAYFINWSAHSSIVKRLLAGHSFDRLVLHTKVLLTTDDEWISSTDRGVEILAKKINWLEDRVADWEARRGVA